MLSDLTGISATIVAIFMIIIFLLGVIGLQVLKSKYHKNFNFRVLTALFIGLIFGFILQIFFGAGSNDLSPVIEKTTTFMSIFSTIYINLLQLIVIPLILVSITTSIIDAGGQSKVGKKLLQIIAVLLVTVTIAASIGITSVYVFRVDGEAIVKTAQTSSNQSQQEDAAQNATEHQEQLQGMNYAELITAPITTNFGFLVGATSSAALSTVIFGLFLGYSTLQIKKRKPEKSQVFIEFMKSFKEIVLSMVREILKITPFGIFALMTIFGATNSLKDLSALLTFLIATYAAIIAMYIVHLIIVSIQGLSPIQLIEKTWPVLVFGFGSRSSIASIPLNVEAQTQRLGVDSLSADLSATFGATIGQNGCAGIYPAMLAVLAAQATGVDITWGWIVLLLVVVAVSSFGIAGVGGGATFAAVAVLSILGLPVTIAATLVAIEPLLDMARTTLNISDAMVAGVTVSNINGELDKEKFNGVA